MIGMTLLEESVQFKLRDEAKQVMIKGFGPT
jgi:hypothetical protein